MPLIRVAVHGVSMDMAMLQRSNAIHISIKAERATMDDLRLMYRCVRRKPAVMQDKSRDNHQS